MAQAQVRDCNDAIIQERILIKEAKEYNNVGEKQINLIPQYDGNKSKLIAYIE